MKRGVMKGEGVITVEGRSEAERARLIYTIEEGNDDGLFEIDMDTGDDYSRVL